MSLESVRNGVEIDRIAPTRRPSGRTVMRQNWHDLLFLHWSVPAEHLRPLIPAELELDTHEGNAYVGLVPFTMTGVRPIWTPAWRPMSDFHETNVRTYVHREGRDPGVWFFSLDAANLIAVRLARAWFKLPYYFARMSLKKEMARTSGGDHSANDRVTITYESKRQDPTSSAALCRVSCSPDGPVRPAEPGTLEHFLVERYTLYAGSNGRLYSGRVHHTAYPLQSAVVHSWEETLISAAGIIRPNTQPLAHYSSGVNVSVFPLRGIR